jgi:hypothetical protein
MTGDLLHFDCSSDALNGDSMTTLHILMAKVAEKLQLLRSSLSAKRSPIPWTCHGRHRASSSIVPRPRIQPPQVFHIRTMVPPDSEKQGFWHVFFTYDAGSKLGA